MFCFVFYFHFYFFFFFFFLATLQGTKDLSSLTRDSLQWKHKFLTTGLPGRSLFPFLNETLGLGIKGYEFYRVSLHYYKQSVFSGDRR